MVGALTKHALVRRLANERDNARRELDCDCLEALARACEVGCTKVARPARGSSRGVREADVECEELRPGWIGFVGKEAYRGTFNERPELGIQERRLADTRLFVLPSTSPANAAVPWDERLRWFRALAKASAR